MTYPDPSFFGSSYTAKCPNKNSHFQQHFSHKFTDIICRYFNSFCFVVVQVYQLHSSSIVELTSTIQEHPISDPSTRKFFSPFAEPLKSGERRRASPVASRCSRRGSSPIGSPPSPSSHLQPFRPRLFRNFSNHPLSYWEANSYYPTGLIMEKGNLPNFNIG